MINSCINVCCCYQIKNNTTSIAHGYDSTACSSIVLVFGMLSDFGAAMPLVC